MNLKNSKKLKSPIPLIEEDRYEGKREMGNQLFTSA